MEDFRKIAEDYNLEWYSNNDPWSIKKATEVTIDLLWEQIENRIEKINKELEKEQSDISYLLLSVRLRELGELNDLVKKY